MGDEKVTSMKTNFWKRKKKDKKRRGEKWEAKKEERLYLNHRPFVYKPNEFYQFAKVFQAF